MEKEQMIREFSAFLPFVRSLSGIGDELWNAPLGEGKWSVGDVIAHMMLWDRYFLEEAIARIARSEPVTVRHLDFDEFNKSAVQYAKGNSRLDIIDAAVNERDEIIRILSALSEEEFMMEHMDGDGRPFSAYGYVQGFIPHDVHHMDQLQAFISKHRA